LETSGQAAGDFVKNSVGATDQILRQIQIHSL
jgi:3-deoxy-D-manno-octulosonic-acid transferase